MLDNTDCDDSLSGVNPSEIELCDSANNDEDCDGYADDNDSGGATGKSTYYTDSDSDTYGDETDSGTDYCDPPSTVVLDNTDCDDSLSGVNPSQIEICDSDNNDEDCDGYADDLDPEGPTSGTSTYNEDADGDSYGSSNTSGRCDSGSGWTSTTGDCDDNNNNIHPGASEICQNNSDENCNGSNNEGCSQGHIGCGGPGAMGPGWSGGCGFSGSRWVTGVSISVGCNDGETGNYTLTFDDGSSVNVGASCNSSTSFSGRWVSSGTLRMNSGGGGDNWLSFTCCGSGGWGVYYQ